MNASRLWPQRHNPRSSAPIAPQAICCRCMRSSVCGALSVFFMQRLPKSIRLSTAALDLDSVGQCPQPL
eukprot:scaffold62145_cov41-Tisochrysis_lutea.AAC.1